MRLAVIAPHPDDEVIGCGATIINWPGEVFVVYCKNYPKRVEEAKSACKKMDANAIFLSDLKELKPVLDELKPKLVFSPHPEEEHYWHKEVARAVRKIWKGELWEYEIWSMMAETNTAVWFDEPLMKKKLVALKQHKSQCSKKDLCGGTKAFNYWRAIMMPTILNGHGTNAKQDAKYCEAFRVFK